MTVLLTPVKVSVRVLAPEPNTTELVPDPEQSVQLKTPDVVNEVVNPNSPFGKITNGSAWLVIDVNRQNRAARSSLRIDFLLFRAEGISFLGFASLTTTEPARQLL
jgi:hypothetical protein